MVFAARQLIKEQGALRFIVGPVLWTLGKHTTLCTGKHCVVCLRSMVYPPTTLSVIKSLHEGMSAVVRVGDCSTDPTEVTNGLRQGCTLAPTLFNLYFSAVVRCWRDRCPQAGVRVKYRAGRKLVGDRTAKARLQEVQVTESKFGDDVALYATIAGDVEDSTVEREDNIKGTG